jgi:hypothetical protein
MAEFRKFGNLSSSGWDANSHTQTISVGQSAHIGLLGGAPLGDLIKVADPTICVVHEEPPRKGQVFMRHFLLTALRPGETKISAVDAWDGYAFYGAEMTVKVVGKSGVRLIFFPGERLVHEETVGTIYVIGADGDSMPAAGGPPVGGPDRGGHTFEPTPAGNYVLGPKVHVTTASWPASVIPWGAALRLNAAGEVEYEVSQGRWVQATGPSGTVTNAQMAWNHRAKVYPKMQDVIKEVRDMFLDDGGGLQFSTWVKNDFGRWGWNLRLNGQGTAYWVHTTPDDEYATEQHRKIWLANSHGCIHLRPADRQRFDSAGYLKEGIPFEVRPYTETGPP